MWTVALALVPLTFAAERFAYYAIGSSFVLSFRDLGLSNDAITSALDAWRLAMYAAPLVGGGIAFVTGPRAAIVAGGIAASAGAVGMLSSVPSICFCGLALFAIGSGLLRPTAFGLAAEATRAISPVAVAAAFTLVIALANLSASMATWITPILYRSFGRGSFALLAIAVAVAAGSAFAAARLRPKAELLRTPVNRGGVTLLAILLGSTAPYWVSTSAIFELTVLALPSTNLGIVFAMSGVATILGAFGIAGALFVAALAKARMPIMLLTALGLFVAAVAALGAGVIAVTMLSAVALNLLTAFAEVLVIGTTLAIASYAFDGRATAFGIGLWLTVTSFPGRIGKLAEPRALSLICGMLMLVASVALFVWRARLASRLEHRAVSDGADAKMTL